MFAFQPITPHSQDEFNILFKGEVVATFFWKRNHPTPKDKVAIIRYYDNVAIVPNENAAIHKLITWDLEFFKEVLK